MIFRKDVGNMKKLTIYLLTMFCLLSLTGCAKTDNENTAESTDNITAPATTETKTQSEVLQFLIDKYDLKFRLWGPVEHDLYVFHVYPDHADYECHIMMSEKSDDIEQYWNDLEWEIVGDELIIKNHIGGEWTTVKSEE
jgi:hypothetical protein